MLNIVLLVAWIVVPQDRDIDAPRLIGSPAITLTLLAYPQVRNELGLSPEQITSCETLAKRYQARMRAYYGIKRRREEKSTGRDEDFESYLQFELTGDLAEILSAAQLNRIIQINILKQDLYIYDETYIITHLKITNEQRTKIDDARERARVELARVAGEHLDPNSNVAKVQEVQDRLRKVVKSVLTEEQRGRLGQMEGPAIDLKFGGH